MKKILFLIGIFTVFLSCSSDETSVSVNPPPAPIVKYTISLSAGEGGTVSTTGGVYETGQTVSVTATPQGEYVFTSWSDGNTNATRTITVSSNSTLTANFEKRKYPLTVNFEGEGEVIEEIVNSGRTTEYDSGTTVKLTAQAAAEWVFVGWTGDIESTEESVQIVIGESKTVTATFEKKKYPLTVNIEGEGEVLEEIVNEGRTTDYNSGTTVKLTAQPEDEWLFTGWSGDIGEVDPTENPIQLNIIESKTVTATFEKKKYPLTVNIEGEGEVLEEIVNAGRTTTDYTSGSVIRLTANPSDEWVFTGWSGSVSSTDNPIELSVNESKSITATFQVPDILFTNRSPMYPSINSSIGNIKTNYYHPSVILTPDIIEKFIDLRENCDCTGCSCSTNYNLYNNHSRYIDFNNDGKIDLFGWLMNNSGGYGVGYGKYVVVNDVLNNPTSTYYDSNIWFGGRMEVNDFNGDGVDDILVYNQNDHGDNQGGHFTERTPLEIIYFNIDGTFRITQVGDSTGTHELATFDIDSDGDVDIVNFEYYMGPDGTENNTSVQVPLFYINDGNGNFEIVKTNFLEYEYYLNTVQIDFNFISVDAFDLDNDGYIDLIVGNTTEKVDGYCIYDNPDDPFEQNCYSLDSTEGIRIFWGNANSTFSENDMTVFDRSYFSNGSEKGPLGFNFIDLNNDGNYEVISTGFHDNLGDYGPYSGGFIDIYSNDGNRGFSRITENTMDNYEWFYENKSYVQTGDIPLFYDIGVVDVDSDGDYDLIPHTINTGSVNLLDSNNGVDTFKYQTNIGKNFFWRNDGGFFTLNKDRKDYDN